MTDANERIARDYGAIDILINPHTEHEYADRTLDEGFFDKVRFPVEDRKGVPIPELVRRLDSGNIEAALLVAAKNGDLRMKGSSHWPIERIAEYCSVAPDRLFGLAGADASRISESLRDIERAVTEFGFVGVHLLPHWFGEAPDHAKFYPFYAKCVELDVPIMMQVGHCLDYQRDRVLPSVGRPITLDRIAIDFPELRLIGIHVGWPWTEEMIAVAYKHENVYIAGDAYAPKYWPKEFVHFADRWRPEKALWGSDWPAVDPVRSVREVEELGMSEKSQRMFLRDNAIKLFKLEKRLRSASTPARFGGDAA
ncbi:amidohydrolase family protein [Streptomyces plumbiresistens]|uniref:Amidohydrolase family protein n=1 Tax=Streptomyces plumbiresistens TaxID=511811 RepID=A0ABP7SK01_9ACTN